MIKKIENEIGRKLTDFEKKHFATGELKYINSRWSPFSPSEIEGYIVRHNMTFDQAVQQIKSNHQKRKDMWLIELDKWANFHGITRKQAANILFNDQSPTTAKSLYWAEVNGYAREVLDT